MILPDPLNLRAQQGSAFFIRIGCHPEVEFVSRAI
jgi:hypothetical protein